MTYVDAFVAAVPTQNKEKYRKHAEEAAVFFKKHGVLSIVECWGDDVPKGEVTDFYGAVKAKDDETVVFSWIVWPDKATRDTNNQKVFEDMEAAGSDMSEMPFDGKRMIFGGFQPILEV